MSGVDKEEFKVGDMCNVRVQTGSKIVNYTAELLAMGKLVEIFVHVESE